MPNPLWNNKKLCGTSTIGKPTAFRAVAGLPMAFLFVFVQKQHHRGTAQTLAKKHLSISSTLDDIGLERYF